MSANLDGPCGTVFAEIINAHDLLEDLIPEVPFGITDDPRAAPAKVTLTELARARDMLNQANELLERINNREAKYSLNNGWTMPGDTD